MENIRSYEKLEVDFSVGSTLLSGDIGAGKTSILLAIQFGLFGLQPGQKGTSLLKNGEDTARVVLDFEVDGGMVSLERTIKKSKSGSITQDKNILAYGEKIEEISTSEMKSRVIDILNYPKEFAKKSNLLYKFTVYTPQEEMKAIIQERPEIRLDTLRHIFGIDRYKRIKENSQILLQKVKESIKVKDILIREINPLKEKMVLLTEKKISLAKEVNNLAIEEHRKQEQLKLLENELMNLRRSLDEKNRLDSSILQKEAELQGKKTIKERLQKELFSMQSEISNNIDFSQEMLQSVLEHLNKNKSILEDLQNKFIESNSRISVLDSKKESALGLKEKIISMENCPTCFQIVSHEHKDKISKRTQFDLEDVDRELEQKFLEKQQLVKDIEKTKELIRGYEVDLQKLERDRIRFEHQKNVETKIKSEVFVLDRTKSEIETLNQEIENLRTASVKYSESQIAFDSVQQKSSVLSSELRAVQISLAEKRKEQELQTIQLEELNKTIVAKEKIKEQLNYLRSLQDWLQEKFLAMISLTEKNVLAKLRSEFSNIFSQWFNMLVPESLSARLDEDFTPIIENQDYEIDYDFLSGGERTAVALAYRLALNQTLNSLISNIKTKGVLILDEPTDGFSGEQLDKLRDIFDQLNTEQLIVVSHEQKMEDFVDNVVKVSKESVSSVRKVDITKG
jgi:exonuclease SbcC